MSQNHTHGYTLAYERDELQFPVYVVALIGAGFTAAAIAFDNKGVSGRNSQIPSESRAVAVQKAATGLGQQVLLDDGM